MADFPDPILIIFIKNLIKGEVKTRLAIQAGDDFAYNVYRQLLDHTRQVTTAVDARKWLFYHAFVPKMDEWSERVYTKFRQLSQIDLGVRMESAMKQALETGGKTIIIGSDCPGLRTSHLSHAFKLLDTHDMVVGPATDGGFYLLGLSHWIDGLFEGVRWSTGDVLKQILSNFGRRHPSGLYFPLEELSDIDYLSDWQKHGHLILAEDKLSMPGDPPKMDS